MEIPPTFNQSPQAPEDTPIKQVRKHLITTIQGHLRNLIDMYYPKSAAKTLIGLSKFLKHDTKEATRDHLIELHNSSENKSVRRLVPRALRKVVPKSLEKVVVTKTFTPPPTPSVPAPEIVITHTEVEEASAVTPSEVFSHVGTLTRAVPAPMGKPKAVRRKASVKK